MYTKGEGGNIFLLGSEEPGSSKMRNSLTERSLQKVINKEDKG